MFQSLHVSEVKGCDDHLGTAVVGRRNTLELLLPGCVPDLEAVGNPCDLKALDFKVHADRGLVIMVENILAQPVNEASLSHVEIANDHHLGESEPSSACVPVLAGCADAAVEVLFELQAGIRRVPLREAGDDAVLAHRGPQRGPRGPHSSSVLQTQSVG